jgi:putative salt-induced outer membrane protein YdiY
MRIASRFVDGRPRGLLCALAALAAGLAGFAGPAQAAPRTDIVILMNGDRITGEVKSLEQGKLEFKTDAAGTLYIEWDKIQSVETTQYLRVELSNGLRYFGQAPRPVEDGTLRMVADEDAKGWNLKMASVIRIDPIEKEFLKRIDGYLTAGYNYTKSNDLQQFTFTGGLNARATTHQWSLDGSSTVTTQQGDDDSARWNLAGGYRHFLADRWFLQGFGGFEGNDELGLDLRSTVGGAYGRYLAQTNHQDWVTYAGLAYTRENYTGRDQADSVEGVLGTQYSFYRYDLPEASLDATLNVLPSLTQSGRVRVDGKLRSRYEIVKDLFFEVSLYGNYDSDPGETAISNSDYGLTTSLGYSF